MMSEAFSATMIVGAFVLQEGTNGMTEASTTSEAVDPAKFKIGRHNRFWPSSHGACAGGMMVSFAGPVGILNELLVGIQIVARQTLGENIRLQRRLA